MRHGGKLFVVGIVAIGLVAASTAFWYHRATTRRALGFWGGEAARLIVAAPRAELLWLPEGGDLAAALLEAPGTLRSADLIAARGFVHARRALVEDANFDWEEPPPRDLPRWDCAMRFTGDDQAAVVLVAFDPPRVQLAGGRESLAVGRVAEPLAELLRTAMDAAAPHVE